MSNRRNRRGNGRDDFWFDTAVSILNGRAEEETDVHNVVEDEFLVNDEGTETDVQETEEDLHDDFAEWLRSKGRDVYDRHGRIIEHAKNRKED